METLGHTRLNFMNVDKKLSLSTYVLIALPPVCSPSCGYGVLDTDLINRERAQDIEDCLSRGGLSVRG